MEHNKYITDQEREKCRKVAAAFSELEKEDIAIVAVDAGRYGFVKLSHYDEFCGFNKAVCYTDSTALFNGLWRDWLNEQLFQIALEKPALMNLEYEEIFRLLPGEKQQELMRHRHYFAQKSGIADA